MMPRLTVDDIAHEADILFARVATVFCLLLLARDSADHWSVEVEGLKAERRPALRHWIERRNQRA
jgi:hypothetical protein